MIQLGFNAQCEQLKDKLVRDINEAKLPIIVVNYILKEIQAVANEKEIKDIMNEKLEYQKLIEEEKSDGNTDEKG